ncbi:MAG TPA: peptidylprolyl isomerase [Prolixibacteraceae bacterium]|nr:peptidylprolyl isomerase [Prolixibacteraceae bacterium]
MNYRFFIILLIVNGCFLLSVQNLAGKDPGKRVLIKTSFGDMTVLLYDDTPQHRDNFIQLVENGFYNGLLFHRVIKDFMIQGGDPESKKAPAGKRLGSGGPGYQIPAEIKPEHFHKKGALAAARTGDAANPERKSSGSQFYIVQGKTWTREELNDFQEKMKFQTSRSEAMKLFRQRQEEVQRLQQEGKTDSANAIMVSIQEEADKKAEQTIRPISEERISIYTTLGGTPHLDDTYTVFGEVLDGFSVLDSIAGVPTLPGDRPVENVEMEIVLLD